MSTFIGRKASLCRKCRGADHWVNRMGGIVCSTCNPPKSAADVVARLVVEGGVWIDPENRFELGERPTAPATLPGRAAIGPVASRTSPAETLANAVTILARGRGPGGEFGLDELDLFGLESIWAVGAGNDVTLCEGRVRWQGRRVEEVATR